MEISSFMMLWYYQMHHRLPKLIIFPIIIVVTLGLNFIGDDIQLVKVISGFLIVLVFPGYSLTIVLFPDRDLSRLEIIVFSLCSSMTISIIGGIFLNFTLWGLHQRSWLIFLGTFSLALSLVGILLRRNWNLVFREIRSTFRFNLVHLELLSIGLIMMFMAIGFSRFGEINQHRGGFTQLWGIPDTETSIRIGIQSYELFGAEYRLHILMDEITILDQIVELNSEEVWETIVNLPIDSNNMWIVEANLYLLDEPNEIYRRILLTQPNNE